jgi:hypothetical protein
VVVHDGVDEVEAAGPPVGPPVRTPLVLPERPPAAALGDPSELLHVHVHELARCGPFVAAHDPAGGPVHPREPVHPMPHEDAVHGRHGQPHVRGDAGRPHLCCLRNRTTRALELLRRPVGTVVCDRRPVMQPRLALAWKRDHQRCAVVRDTPISSATCATGRPCSILRTRVRRPCNGQTCVPMLCHEEVSCGRWLRTPRFHTETSSPFKPAYTTLRDRTPRTAAAPATATGTGRWSTWSSMTASRARSTPAPWARRRSAIRRAGHRPFGAGRTGPHGRTRSRPQRARTARLRPRSSRSTCPDVAPPSPSASTRGSAPTPTRRRSRPCGRPSTPEGTITAGNASQLSDGAAALVLTTARTAQGARPPRPRTHPRGRRRRRTRPVAAPPSGGRDPPCGGPRIGIDPTGFDRYEINEAFASVAIASTRALGIDRRPGQRAWWRDRPRASARLQRRTRRRDAARGAAAGGWRTRRGRAVRRWGPGRGAHRRGRRVSDLDGARAAPDRR